MKRGLLLVLAIAAIWRVVFLLSIQGTPLAHLEEWTATDMATFVAQAHVIADGDLLAEHPVYPYHTWMQRIPQANWNAWHPPGMFYQPPLYSYALALLMRLTPDWPSAARWIQALLGIIACGLMYGLTRRLFGPTAALAAGLLQAVCGPLLMAESQLLRDGSILCAELFILWLAVGALSGLRRGRLTRADWRWRAWLLGLSVGALAMLHESAVFLFFLIAAWGVWNGARRFSRRGAAAWAALLLLGALVGFGPMLARNIALGAPVGPRYFGSMLAFATANHPDNPDTTMTNLLPDRPMRFDRDMLAAHGHPLPLVLSMVREYATQPWRWPLRWGRRVLALLLGSEPNENLCYAFFQDHVPILAFTIGFYWIWPLGLSGALILGWRRWRGRIGGGLGLVMSFGLLTFGLISAVHPFGRYRLMLLPALIPLAGFTLARLLSSFRRSANGQRWIAWKKFGPAAALVLAFSALQFGIGALPGYRALGGLRTAEYVATARILLTENKPDAAAKRLSEGVSHFPSDRGLHLALDLAEGVSYQSRGEYDKALAAWQRALARDPGNPLARLGRATAAARQPLQPPAAAP